MSLRCDKFYTNLYYTEVGVSKAKKYLGFWESLTKGLTNNVTQNNNSGVEYCFLPPISRRSQSYIAEPPPFLTCMRTDEDSPSTDSNTSYAEERLKFKTKCKISTILNNYTLKC